MFCPKCGTQNPDNGKFCRSCGTDLTHVSEAISGKLKSKSLTPPMAPMMNIGGACDETEKTITLESALSKIFIGLAFLIISVVLAFTHMGRNWWFWMLIPGFAMMGSGIAQFIQVRKDEQRTASLHNIETNKAFSPPVTSSFLPPTQNDYISPTAAVAESRYKTGEIVPPSVIEETTRHLEINQEGETMTLPKQNQ